MSYAINIVRQFFPEVKDVIDAKSILRIDVTKKDAASKAAKSHIECALAVACKRHMKLDGVVISRTTAYLVKGKQAIRYLLPVSARLEVASFDRGGGFSPGIYHLSRVPASRRIGRSMGSSTHHKAATHNARQIKFRHFTDRIRHVLAGAEGGSE